MDRPADRPAGPGRGAERIAVLFLQPGCNMTCRFCATEDGFEALTLEGARALLEALRAGGVDNVILGGGEPFAWKPGALELARHAKSSGFTVQIGTNGIALPDDFADCPWVDRWILPLESAEANVHDSLRIHRGGHHRVVTGRLAALARAGRAVTVSTVVMQPNVDGLGRLGRYLAGYQEAGGALHAWHLYKLLHVGRGGSPNGTRLDIPAEDYHRACAEVRAREASLRVLKRPDMLHSRTVGFFWMQGGKVRAQSPYDAPLPGTMLAAAAEGAIFGTKEGP